MADFGFVSGILSLVLNRAVKTGIDTGVGVAVEMMDQRMLVATQDKRIADQIAYSSDPNLQPAIDFSVQQARWEAPWRIAFGINIQNWTTRPFVLRTLEADIKTPESGFYHRVTFHLDAAGLLPPLSHDTYVTGYWDLPPSASTMIDKLKGLPAERWQADRGDKPEGQFCLKATVEYRAGRWPSKTILVARLRRDKMFAFPRPT